MANDRILPGGGETVFASATKSGAVTASDTTILDFHAIYVGVGGDVAIKHETSGTAVTYVGLAAGSILPVSGVHVMSANTSASSLVWMRW